MIKGDILAMPMDDYFWHSGISNSVRIVNVLRACFDKDYQDANGRWIHVPITVEDIVRIKRSEYLKFRNFGKVSLREMTKVLEDDGLHIGATDEEIQEWKGNTPDGTPLEIGKRADTFVDEEIIRRNLVSYLKELAGKGFEAGAIDQRERDVKKACEWFRNENSHAEKIWLDQECDKLRRAMEG